METLKITDFTMDYREHKALSCTAPCSLYSVLLQHNIIEDPYFGENEEKYERIAECGCDFSAEFDVPLHIFGKSKIMLTFFGVDTLSEIYLNGSLLGKTDNMHRIWKFDVKKLLKITGNKLKVRFFSPIEYVEKRNNEKPLWCTELGILGYGYIRKANCSFGWDWGPVLPDIGFYRDIELSATDTDEISDFFVRQVHSDNTVTLNIEPEIDFTDKKDEAILVEIESPDGTVRRQRFALDEKICLDIVNPELWWANGYGAQPLYRITLLLERRGTIVSQKTQRIGLRTLTVSTERDEWGSEFCFKLNGKKIFSKGANYIPIDAILSRVTKDRTEQLLADCVDANFNTVRVWGGGYYPDDYFYELCDEKGLIVWQDFMFACTALTVDDAFYDTVKAEFIEVIRRLRNHACIGLFSGNNEIEDGWRTGGFQDDFCRLKADYLLVFEQLLPSLTKKYAPNIFYHPSSPSSVGSFIESNAEVMGDMHYWCVWHGNEPFESYKSIFPRFLSEYGYEAYPSVETLKTVVSEGCLNPFSPQMDKHQKCRGGNTKILLKMADYFPYASDLSDFVYITQVMQGEAIKCGAEHLRRHRGRCMGSLYWQLNDLWPTVSWSSRDYYGRYKALHYYAKRFYAPILLSADNENGKILFNVCNETLHAFNGLIEASLIKNDFTPIKTYHADVCVGALSSKDCFKIDLTDLLKGNERNYSMVFRLVSESGKVLSDESILFVKPKFFHFAEPNFNLEIRKNESGFIAEISADKFAKGVCLQVADPDAIFEDNYFSIIDSSVKTVAFKSKLSLEELKHSFKINSVNRIVCES